jgi:hypothetical protein
MGPSGLCGGLAHLVVVDCFVSFVFCVFCFVLPTVLALFPDCSPLLNEKRAMHILKKSCSGSATRALRTVSLCMLHHRSQP